MGGLQRQSGHRTHSSYPQVRPLWQRGAANSLLHGLPPLGWSTDSPHLGLMVKSLLHQATLLEDRIELFQQCLSLFRRGCSVTFRMCLRVLRLMVSTFSVVPLGPLRMRDFLRGVFVQLLCTRHRLHRQIEVTSAHLSALHSGRVPQSSFMAFPRGGNAIAVHKGNAINRVWIPHFRIAHINDLEFLTGLL